MQRDNTTQDSAETKIRTAWEQTIQKVTAGAAITPQMLLLIRSVPSSDIPNLIEMARTIVAEFDSIINGPEITE